MSSAPATWTQAASSPPPVDEQTNGRRVAARQAIDSGVGTAPPRSLGTSEVTIVLPAPCADLTVKPSTT